MDSARPEYQQAAAALIRGGVIAYPTEGVWGLGCDPWNQEAVERLLELKGRPSSKGLILLASEPDQLLPYLKSLNPNQSEQLVASRGHFITWLVPHAGEIPGWIAGDSDRVAVRLTDHPVASYICAAFGGPIVSTSANPSGMPAALSIMEVRQYFGDLIDVIVPGALGNQNGASEIRDMESGALVRPRGK